MCKYAKSHIWVITGGADITGGAGISEIFKIANQIKICKKCKYETSQILVIIGGTVITGSTGISEILVNKNKKFG